MRRGHFNLNDAAKMAATAKAARVGDMSELGVEVTDPNQEWRDMKKSVRMANILSIFSVATILIIVALLVVPRLTETPSGMGSLSITNTSCPSTAPITFQTLCNNHAFSLQTADWPLILATSEYLLANRFIQLTQSLGAENISHADAALAMDRVMQVIVNDYLEKEEKPLLKPKTLSTEWTRGINAASLAHVYPKAVLSIDANVQGIDLSELIVDMLLSVQYLYSRS